MFNEESGRVNYDKEGHAVALYMSPNGLGWYQTEPITEPAVLRTLLVTAKAEVIVPIPLQIHARSILQPEVLLRQGEQLATAAFSVPMVMEALKQSTALICPADLADAELDAELNGQSSQLMVWSDEHASADLRYYIWRD